LLSRSHSIALALASGSILARPHVRELTRCIRPEVALPFGYRFLFALLALGMSVSSARASVIDFNEIASAPCLGSGASPITSDGFQFTATAGGFGSLTICDDSSGYASNGSNFLTEVFNSTITMTAEGGGTFSLNSLDATRLHQGFDFDATEWRITGHLSGGGTVTTTFQLDDVADGVGGADDFQNFIFPNTFVDLTSATFVGWDAEAGQQGQAAYGALDNIVVNQPVPEPSTGLLVFAGLLVLAGSHRART